MTTLIDDQQKPEDELALAQERIKQLELEFAAAIEANNQTVGELKAALEIKTEFIAHLNHELRNPLNCMLPMIEFALRSELTAETREQVLMIKNAGLTLLDIVNNVLDFTKIDAGKLEVVSVEFNLRDKIEDIAQMFSPAAASKNILLLATIDKDVPELVIGDPKKLRQVLLNLCGNAVKFTESGVITLKVSTTKLENKSRQLLFTVNDSGQGICEELMSHLFTPFFQGPSGVENEVGGTGLGLCIAKQLVELMSGKMFVESTLGVGSTFGVYLPLEEPINQEILRVWASPQSSPSNLAPERIEVALPTSKIIALTLEPIHQGQYAIAESLKNFDLSTRSCDSAQALKAVLLGRAEDSETTAVVFLDTVRLKDESQKFCELINNSAARNSIKIIEVVAQEDLKQTTPSNQGQEILKIPMPLKKKVLAACLGKIADPREFHKAMRAIQSKTHADELHIDTKLMRPVPGEKKQALVADDNKLNQRVAFLFLTDLGFETDLVSDGIEAVRAFKRKHYDLVFLDCQMPQLNGFEAAKIIKEIQERRGIAVPLIAVTADSTDSSRDECFTNGMDDFISKPIDPESLEKVVTNWLGNSFLQNTPSRATKINKLSSGTFTCQHVNLVKLRKIYSEQQLRGILNLFRENCKVDIAELNSHLSSGQLILFQQRLERFKDCCKIIDAVQIAKLCTRVMEASNQGDFAITYEQMEKLSKMINLLDRELEATLADRTTYTLPTISQSI